MYIRNLDVLKEKDITSVEKNGIALCRQASAEGSILLENNGLLPIRPGAVALYGFGARQIINTGIGSGDVLPRYIVNIEEGLENAGFTVVTKAWLDAFDEIYREHRKKLRQELMEESDRTGIDCLHCLYSKPHEHIPCQSIEKGDIADTDTAIYVISRKEGEECDNVYAPGGYMPAEWELEQLRILRREYANLILLLNIGSVLDMQKILKISPDAVLLIYQGGAEIGNAVAEMLTGKVPPSGKLTTTWAKDYWDYSSSRYFGNNTQKDHVLYKEGIYVGYRYFDSFGIEPQYPFGYGMTYTDFRIIPDKIETENGRVTILLTVENTGSLCGKEVVQLYISPPGGNLDKPYQKLCAYKKTGMLEGGQKEQLKLKFSMEEQGDYDPSKAVYKLDPGDYILRVGNSSRNTHVAGVVQLEEEHIVKKVKNLFEVPVEFTELESDRSRFWTYEGEQEELKNAPVFLMKSEDLDNWGEVRYSGEAPNYISGVIDPETVNLTAGSVINIDVPKCVSLPKVMAGECTMEALVASMNEEELLHLVTGQLYVHPVYRMNCYSPHVLGACGETTNYFEEQSSPKKIPYVIFADGGSGLRLIRRFQTDQNGEIIYLDPVLNCENGEFGIRDYREGLPDYYQNTTALPIPVQLASTWNTSLLRKIGDIIGQEMEKFGVDLWLAPGINLHRNPLGGRNFEYYSEDPCVSAATAIAMILGVQSHPGRGTTVKHVAANNQETARTSHVACVSERAMRELYLRAFELTVKYADPMSLMTSLNCVNGPHSANSRELTTCIIKDEWKFRGLITTDWNTTRRDRGANTAECIRAGTHIIMPGSEENLEQLRAALHNKSDEGDKVYLGELQRSAMGYLSYLTRTAKCKFE